ncbi:hypothetical protein MGG_15213 [Pyricularia oryzae 70-15]|uniref:Uncharacterized protein n=1 Tax=Pyricularia oryzae (strain 70-15 / ATCC MYA-4617 / FGSC 8958) TaxID=242507 RepID=G4N301_PYRO7|nr:uncharacterized protein MGG_15213 [Pyricularia oryzae 70-15]EHA51760.1 hypothetical protein MGG_15213 [Pyricularia oryzae 70-15]
MSVAKGEASGDEFALCVTQHTLAWFEETSSGALMCGIIMKGFVAYTVDQGGAQNDVFFNIATSLCGYLQVVAAASPLMSLLEAKGPRKLVNASELMFLDRLLGLLEAEQLHARDLAVVSGTLVTLEVPDSGYGDTLDTASPGAAILRYGADDFKFTYGASAVGADIFGCDWSAKLATLSSGDPVSIEPLPRTQSLWLIKTLPFRIEPVADALSWLLENTTNNDDFLHHADSYAYLNVMQNFNQSRLSAFVSQQQPIFHVTFAAADLATGDLFSSYSCQYRAYAAGRDGTLGTLTSVPFLESTLLGYRTMLGRRLLHPWMRKTSLTTGCW